jgi:hypothetical protein
MSPRVQPAPQCVAATATAAGKGLVEDRPNRTYAHNPSTPDHKAVTGQTTFMIHIFWRFPRTISSAIYAQLAIATERATIERILNPGGTIFLSGHI